MTGTDQSRRTRKDPGCGVKTLRLHIGLPKTASTWLQTALFPRLPLRLAAMPEAALFAEGPGRLLPQCLARSDSVWDGMGDGILGALTGRDRAAERDRGDDLLVSEEGVGRAGSRPGHLQAHLEGLRRSAEEWGFARLRILCLVRRQDRWLASHYAQVSDRLEGTSQAGFEAEAARLVDPRADRHRLGALLDYRRLHAALAGAAGAEAVTILPHELLQTDRAAFLEALTGFLGEKARRCGRR